MGGVEKVADKKDGGGLDGFDENRIVIPVGITPQTLKNYTLYDMLGLAGDLGATANTEVRVGGVRGGVLGAFGCTQPPCRGHRLTPLYPLSTTLCVARR